MPIDILGMEPGTKLVWKGNDAINRPDQMAAYDSAVPGGRRIVVILDGGVKAVVRLSEVQADTSHIDSLPGAFRGDPLKSTRKKRAPKEQPQPEPEEEEGPTEAEMVIEKIKAAMMLEEVAAACDYAMSSPSLISAEELEAVEIAGNARRAEIFSVREKEFLADTTYVKTKVALEAIGLVVKEATKAEMKPIKSRKAKAVAKVTVVNTTPIPAKPLARKVETIEIGKKGQKTGTKFDVVDVTPKPVRKAKGKRADDYLMWVGRSNYPTIESFVKEAAEQGVSKRLSKVPEHLIGGRSRIFLAHDEGETGDGVIFGYFVVSHVEILVRDKTPLPVDGKESVTYIYVSEALQEPVRGCGWRSKPGAIYAVNYNKASSFEKALPDHVTTHGSLVLFDKFRDYAGMFGKPGGRLRMRGYKQIDGDKILSSTAFLTSPLARADHDLEFKYAKGKTPKLRDKWTTSELKALFGYVSKVELTKSRAKAFRDFARQTGRTEKSVEYQFYHRKED